MFSLIYYDFVLRHNILYFGGCGGALSEAAGFDAGYD